MTREIPELRVPLGSPEPRGVAVVVRGAKLLVMARRLDGREYAVLPGGCLEPGETPERAAVRELAEECSLEGTAVRRLQRALNAADSAGLQVTGVFEGKTTAAVQRYQADHRIAATGVVLENLWKLLAAGTR